VNLLGNLQGVKPVQEADEHCMVMGHFWGFGVGLKKT
jgi:hypothetical protein